MGDPDPRGGRRRHRRRCRGHSRPVATLLPPERPAPPVPLSSAPQDARRRQDRRPVGPPPPLAHPRGSQGRSQRRPVLLPRPLRQQGPQVREGLHLSGKLIGRRPAQA
ncbi:MAG: hypothetical protein ACK56F_27195, partial [bacterium]